MAWQTFRYSGLSNRYLKSLKLKWKTFLISEIFPFPDNIPFRIDEFKIVTSKKNLSKIFENLEAFSI